MLTQLTISKNQIHIDKKISMIELKNIPESKSKFGKSFGGKLPTQFYEISSNSNYVGEIEFDFKQNEILSIYIDKTFRGKGIAKESINQLFDLYNVKTIRAWSAKSSIPFWKKISTKRLKNDLFIIEKNKK